MVHKQLAQAHLINPAGYWTPFNDPSTIRIRQAGQAKSDVQTHFDFAIAISGQRHLPMRQSVFNKRSSTIPVGA
jgi:hypothetical protein